MSEKIFIFCKKRGFDWRIWEGGNVLIGCTRLFISRNSISHLSFSSWLSLSFSCSCVFLRDDHHYIHGLMNERINDGLISFLYFNGKWRKVSRLWYSLFFAFFLSCAVFILTCPYLFWFILFILDKAMMVNEWVEMVESQMAGFLFCAGFPIFLFPSLRLAAQTRLSQLWGSC